MTPENSPGTTPAPPRDHHLENIRRRELKLQTRRREILALEAEEALDAILEAPSPATLTQSFPDQDLYHLMHKIGPLDFLPVLAMAASDQWEYILDMEVWEDDRLAPGVMTKGFGLLFRAAPERFLRWVIMNKPDYFEFYLYGQMEIKIREHDEPPPDDHDDYMTIDDKFYFRFPGKKPDGAADEPGEPQLSEEIEAPELIEKMLKKLAEMDLSVYHGLILETLGLMPAETEEDQFRLKTVRLAEKGFLPPHEAVGVYQPAAPDQLRKRPPSTEAPAYDPDSPLPPQCVSMGLTGDDLFVNALGLLDPEFRFLLEPELAALVNKVISADRVKLRDPEILAQTLEKTTAYLSLGLETLLEGSTGVEPASNLIRNYFLEDIFRTGSRAGILLKQTAAVWYNNSFLQSAGLPLSFLGEEFLGVVGGLFLERPRYFDNYTESDLYRHFRTLEDVRTTSAALDRVMALDRVLAGMSPLISSFELGVLTYKSLLLTLWAKDRLGLEPDLRPMAVNAFRPFFAALTDRNAGQDLLSWAADASGTPEEDLPLPFKDLMAELLEEVQEEYGTVNPEDLDPRFMPLFLLKAD